MKPSQQHWRPRTTAPTTTTKSWATPATSGTTAAAAAAPPEEWLRRPYTRTIPKDLRDVEQLRRSFEDVRSQWKDMCEKYATETSSLAAQAEAPCTTLPRGTRGRVDALVSQLKAVKQELLSQLNRLLRALSAADDGAASNCSSGAATQNAAGTFSPPESWLGDLILSSVHGIDHLTCKGGRSARHEYLLAIGLARRVWTWSICFACVTMDLELLSGSVSVATQLYFGCPFESWDGNAGARLSDESKLADLLLHSTYDMGGSLTERQLGTAAMSSDASTAQAEVTRHAEEHEIRVFFGVTASAEEGKASYSVGQTAPLSLSSDLSTTPTLGTGFWVHATALCYAVMACDDISAARSLSYFQRAYDVFSAASTELPPRHDGSVNAATDARTENDEDRYAEVARCAIAWVTCVANFLVEEDYAAVQMLLQQEHYAVQGQCLTRSVLPTVAALQQDAARTSENALPSNARLATVCPEGVLFVFLIRLLAEHVVRRRWVKQNVGHSFRPVQPTLPQATSGGGTATWENDVNPNHLRDAFRLETGSGAEIWDSKEVESRNNTNDGAWPTTAVRMSHALQLSFMDDMGNDWPLPQPLLRSAFASV